jgi:hypothetical protein
MSAEERAFYENLAENPPEDGACPRWQPGMNWPVRDESGPADEPESTDEFESADEEVDGD